MAPPYKPAKQPPTNPNSWNPAADPVVAAGPPGSGTVRTRSGKFVDTTMGAYVTGPTDKAYGGDLPPHVPVSTDTGHGADLGAPKTSIWDLPVLKRQQTLRQAGYDVTVDGQPGPQTLTAAKAYLKGIPPAYWNLAWKRNHTPPPADVPPGSTDSSSSGATDTPAAPTRTVTAAPTQTAPNPLEALLKTILGGLGTSTPSTAQLIAQAKAMSDASLLPYKTELERQQAQALTDANRRATFQGNLGAALAELEKTQGPAVQSAYQQAGNDQAGYAKGFATDLANSANADAAKTNAFLKSIGAPDAQMLDTSKGNQIGDLLYGTGGYLPANALAREGAAYSAAADLLPQTAVERGGQLAAQELGAGADAKAKLGQQLIDLQLQRPKLMSDALAQLQDAALKTRAQKQNEALMPLLLAKDFENFPGTNPLTGLPTKTQTSIDLQVGNQKIRLAQFTLETRKTLAALTGYDPATGDATPETKRLLLSEWRATHPPTKGGFTQIQLHKMQATAGQVAHGSFAGIDGDGKHDPIAPLSYQAALKKLVIEYAIPLQMAQKTLNAYWVKPGYDAKFELKGDHYEWVGWVKSPEGRPAKPLKVTVSRRGGK